jgi:general secretion pathway protein I
MRTLAAQPKGFTLLEVLVATAVIAIALAAIIRLAAMSSSNLALLRDKTIAHWVAMNQIAELQASETYPPIGRSSGEEEMAGREWHWSMEIQNTPDKDLRRVQIQVHREEGRDAPSITVLTGFITRFNTNNKVDR